MSLAPNAELPEQQIHETILSANADYQLVDLTLEEFSDAQTTISPEEATNLLYRTEVINEKCSSHMKAMRSSISSNPICRICRCDSVSAPVVQCPCKCKGTIGYVHETCLQKWHAVRRAKFCEICHETYEFADQQHSVQETLENDIGFLQNECFARILKFGMNLVSLTAIACIQMGQAQHILHLTATKAEPLTLLKVCLLIFCSGYFNYTYMDWLNLSLDDIALSLDDWWASRYPFGMEEFED